MSTRNGKGGFACEPASSEVSIPCPCCGGTLTPAMLKQIMDAADRAAVNGAPRPRRGCRGHHDHRSACAHDFAHDRRL